MIELQSSNFISSVAFLVDGTIVGGGFEGKLRHWRPEDGHEVGRPLDARDAILGLAVSQDGKWVIIGIENGWVVVWNAEARAKEKEFKAHANFAVEAVDISPDGTSIATGSHDSTVCVWLRETGERLIGPLNHDSTLAVVKYSPDGRLLATATCDGYSITVFASQDGRPIVHIPVKVGAFDQSLAWSRDSKRLFALADAKIKYLDVSTGTTLSEWPIHSSNDPRGITLASNGRFIAAAADSTVSFWDTTAHARVGPIIEHADVFFSMAISLKYEFATSGAKSTVVRSLRDILPSIYCEDSHCESDTAPISTEASNLEKITRSLIADVHDLRAKHESSESKIAQLEDSVRALRAELAESRDKAVQERIRLNLTIESLRAKLDALDES